MAEFLSSKFHLFLVNDFYFKEAGLTRLDPYWPCDWAAYQSEFWWYTKRLEKLNEKIVSEASRSF